MKIEGTSKTGPSAPARGGKAVSGGAGFGDLLTGGAQAAPAAAPAHSIARIDALLAAQECEDPAGRAARGRMHARSGRILDELESLRMALLSGGLTIGHVIDVADVVAAHRERISDPHLTEIMDEIDLRAQVEIAKFRKSLKVPVS